MGKAKKGIAYPVERQRKKGIACSILHDTVEIIRNTKKKARECSRKTDQTSIPVHESVQFVPHDTIPLFDCNRNRIKRQVQKKQQHEEQKSKEEEIDYVDNGKESDKKHMKIDNKIQDDLSNITDILETSKCYQDVYDGKEKSNTIQSGLVHTQIIAGNEEKCQTQEDVECRIYSDKEQKKKDVHRSEENVWVNDAQDGVCDQNQDMIKKKARWKKKKQCTQCIDHDIDHVTNDKEKRKKQKQAENKSAQEKRYKNAQEDELSKANRKGKNIQDRLLQTQNASRNVKETSVKEREKKSGEGKDRKRSDEASPIKQKKLKRHKLDDAEDETLPHYDQETSVKEHEKKSGEGKDRIHSDEASQSKQKKHKRPKLDEVEEETRPHIHPETSVKEHEKKSSEEKDRKRSDEASPIKQKKHKRPKLDEVEEETQPHIDNETSVKECEKKSSEGKDRIHSDEASPIKQKKHKRPKLDEVEEKTLPHIDHETSVKEREKKSGEGKDRKPSDEASPIKQKKHKKHKLDDAEDETLPHYDQETSVKEHEKKSGEGKDRIHSDEASPSKQKKHKRPKLDEVEEETRPHIHPETSVKEHEKKSREGKDRKRSDEASPIKQKKHKRPKLDEVEEETQLHIGNETSVKECEKKSSEGKDRIHSDEASPIKQKKHKRPKLDEVEEKTLPHIDHETSVKEGEKKSSEGKDRKPSDEASPIKQKKLKRPKLDEAEEETRPHIDNETSVKEREKKSGEGIDKIQSGEASQSKQKKRKNPKLDKVEEETRPHIGNETSVKEREKKSSEGKDRNCSGEANPSKQKKHKKHKLDKVEEVTRPHIDNETSVKEREKKSGEGKDRIQSGEANPSKQKKHKRPKLDKVEEVTQPHIHQETSVKEREKKSGEGIDRKHSEEASPIKQKKLKRPKLDEAEEETQPHIHQETSVKEREKKSGEGIDKIQSGEASQSKQKKRKRPKLDKVEEETRPHIGNETSVKEREKKSSEGKDRNCSGEANPSKQKKHKKHKLDKVEEVTRPHIDNETSVKEREKKSGEGKDRIQSGEANPSKQKKLKRPKLDEVEEETQKHIDNETSIKEREKKSSEGKDRKRSDEASPSKQKKLKRHKLDKVEEVTRPHIDPETSIKEREKKSGEGKDRIHSDEASPSKQKKHKRPKLDEVEEETQKHIDNETSVKEREKKSGEGKDRIHSDEASPSKQKKHKRPKPDKVEEETRPHIDNETSVKECEKKSREGKDRKHSDEASPSKQKKLKRHKLDQVEEETQPHIHQQTSVKECEKKSSEGKDKIQSDEASPSKHHQNVTEENDYFDIHMEDELDSKDDWKDNTTNNDLSKQQNQHNHQPSDDELKEFDINITQLQSRTCEERSETFSFVINAETWEKIAPESRVYGSKRRERRKLTGQWTDVFAEKVNTVYKGCVLGFRYQNVKQSGSRKLFANFLHAHAYCTGEYCYATFDLKIKDEPFMNDEVKVECTRTGIVEHPPKKVNRRKLTGVNRLIAAKEMENKTPIEAFNDYLLKSDEEKMKLGNFSNVPNPSVLRKIVSEQMKKEQLHSNIMAELQVLKEGYESLDDPYIREIGLDPFSLILFSDQQIKILKQYSSTCCLHIDATGSVIQNINDQKRPYLYSIVLRPTPNSTPLSVADMVSTRHTIPKIQYFFSSVQRAVNITGKSAKISRVETDFSYALIQSVLGAFNKMDIKIYIKTCYDILTNSAQQAHRPDLTVLHLCAAHIWRDFTRQLKKYCLKLNPQLRVFLYRAFAVLQNTVEMGEAKTVFADIYQVVHAKTFNDHVQECIDRLEKKMMGVEPDEDKHVDECLEQEDSQKTQELDTELSSKSIRESSPFHAYFNSLIEKLKAEEEILPQTSQTQQNEYYCPQVTTCLMDKFMYLFPVWSGVMLNYHEEMNGNTRTSRDTNSEVENWFKILKKDMGILARRPSKFVVTLRKLVNGRLTELSYPGARKKKTGSSKRKRLKTVLSLSEELWNRKNRSSNAMFQPPQPPPCKMEIKPKPNVPEWGGHVEGQTLTNTCTIDNGLTILYLKTLENMSVNNNFMQKATPVFQTLLSVFTLMSLECFPAAKVVWANFIHKEKETSSRLKDLHGDEADFFFHYLDMQWKSRFTSICSESMCPVPCKDSGQQQGIVVSIPTPVESIQQILDMWLAQESECWASTEDITPGAELETERKRCNGNRIIERTIEEDSPCLVVRVYEMCLEEHITLKQILDSRYVILNASEFNIAGLTLHKSDHYTSIICSEKEQDMWYDGLKGSLQPLPEHLMDYTPSHVVYCRV